MIKGRKSSPGEIDNHLENINQVPFREFLNELKSRMRDVFRNQGETDRLQLPRGIPAGVLNDIMDLNPLSVSIPQKFGGRGGHINEILAMLSAASYESLALSLTLGINSGLFIQPVTKYAKEEVKGRYSTDS